MTMRHRTIGLVLCLAACAASIALASRAEAQAAGSGSFTIATAPGPTAGQVIPTLTWSTTPAGATCTASGDTAWTGTKAGSGTLAMPARALPTPLYGLACTWPGDTTATISWTAPTTNTDGSALAKCAAATDTGPCLAKYKVCRGASATAITDCRDHAFPNSTSTPWGGTLIVGTHFFAVKAVTGDGVESVLSNSASKTITPAMQWTASVGVKVPKEPTNLTVE